jgi:hypothetical protein
MLKIGIYGLIEAWPPEHRLEANSFALASGEFCSPSHKFWKVNSVTY